MKYNKSKMSLKLICFNSKSHTGRAKNAFIVPQSLQTPMQNVNNVWVYLWALLQGPTTVQFSLQWKWYVQTKGGAQVAKSAASFHLRIANEGCLLTWSLQAVSQRLRSVLHWQQASTRETGSANSCRWCLINRFSPSNCTPSYFTAWQGGLKPRSICAVARWTELLMQKKQKNTGTQSYLRVSSDSVWLFSICFVILRGASSSTLAHEIDGKNLRILKPKEMRKQHILLNKQMDHALMVSLWAFWIIVQGSVVHGNAALNFQCSGFLWPNPFRLNNREGGTVNTDLLGFVELMTSCSSGLWNSVGAKISKIGSRI